MTSIQLPTHLQTVAMGTEGAQQQQQPWAEEGYTSWTITMVSRVTPEFAAICEREIGKHEFFEEGDNMFSWHIRASDDDLAYLMLKYF